MDGGDGALGFEVGGDPGLLLSVTDEGVHSHQSGLAADFDQALTALPGQNGGRAVCGSAFTDGADSTRVAMRIADEYGNLRRYSTAAISLTLEGPAELIGENPFSLFGGCGAVWIRAKHEPGTAVLKATHPVMGTKEVRITLEVTVAESV